MLSKILIPGGFPPDRLAILGISVEVEELNQDTIRKADGVLWLGDPASPENDQVVSLAETWNRPYILNPHPKNFRSWVQEVETLYVAGQNLSELEKLVAIAH